MSERESPPGSDLSKPSPARLYDYYLGGKDNFPVDREAAERIRSVMPELEDAAWANRGFLQRAVRRLAELGVRQFIDIGAGLPTRNNTHQVAQAVDPHARVVYADKDPMVLAHARAILAGDPNTLVITADVRRPDEVLADGAVRELIDFDEPVGLLLVAVLHFVADADDPAGLVARYLSELPSGSHLALSHGTEDHQSPRTVEAIKDIYSGATENVYFRGLHEVTRFFDGLDIIPPFDGASAALTFTGQWGAEDAGAADSDGSRWAYCAVARLP